MKEMGVWVEVGLTHDFQNNPLRLAADQRETSLQCERTGSHRDPGDALQLNRIRPSQRPTFEGRQ